MNARILELLKNPEVLESRDLEIIEKEISTQPYFQGLRALFLLGTHRFNSENYHRELSKTAAYTTDKKILYQLINGKKIEPVSEEKLFETVSVAEKPEIDESTSVEKADAEMATEEIIPTEQPLENAVPQYGFIITSSVPEKESESAFINTSVPRISEKVEETTIEVSPENLNDEITKIEQDSNRKEEFSEKVESIEPKTINEEPKFEEIEQASPEKIINESEIKSEEKEIENPSQISFHGLQEFLPEVKIESKEKEILTFAPEKPSTNKHEEEMKRLIAEVEAKMKIKKLSEKPKSEEPKNEHEHSSTELSFAGTQIFEPEKTEEKPKETVVEEFPPKKAKEVEEIEEKIVEQKTETASTEWKPMNFQTSVPDALISKKEGQKIETPVGNLVKTDEIATEKMPENKEELPVMNVSFFSPTIQNIEEKTEKTTESNVPTFINTWQTWLKIDRNLPKEEQSEPVSKEEIKEKAIEKFIETEPKISQLKQEGNFVIKEKKKDISHLMTETLANLYVEQKLYSKAIKAYETLSEKHPEKTEYFNEKIQKIKELRTNNQ